MKPTFQLNFKPPKSSFLFCLTETAWRDRERDIGTAFEIERPDF